MGRLTFIKGFRGKKIMAIGDVPQETREEKQGQVVGTGGPRVGQKSKRPARPNKNIFINAGYSVGTESQQIVPANSGRNYLLIQNKSAGDIYVSFGSGADNFNGIVIASGGFYEPYIVPSSSIHVKAAAASSNVVLVEGFGG
jgi:hypothetical protein